MRIFIPFLDVVSDIVYPSDKGHITRTRRRYHAKMRAGLSVGRMLAKYPLLYLDDDAAPVVDVEGRILMVTDRREILDRFKLNLATLAGYNVDDTQWRTVFLQGGDSSEVTAETLSAHRGTYNLFNINPYKKAMREYIKGLRSQG